jgi:hypothetical protein
MGEKLTPVADVPSTIPTTEDKFESTVIQETFDEKHAHIKDEAGEVAELALASGLATAEESKAVLRKIDLYILPIMSITYG